MQEYLRIFGGFSRNSLEILGVVRDDLGIVWRLAGVVCTFSGDSLDIG